MKHTSIIVLVVLICCALVVGIAAAQGGPPPQPHGPDVPHANQMVLTFQGRLTSATGAPLNTPVQATFRLYAHLDPVIAPTALWISAVHTITPTNGLFTVYLGGSNDVDLNPIIAARTAAIGIQIAPDSEMTPRQPLNSVIGYGSAAGVVGGSSSGTGVVGISSGGIGTSGKSSTDRGIYGESGSDVAGYFVSSASDGNLASVMAINNGNAIGLWATTTGANAGVYGQGQVIGVVGEATANGGIGVVGRGAAGVTPLYAGQFIGNVQVTGNLSKGGGSFKIDHPLDPAHQYLSHSFVESPDMLNIYNGNVTTDANGEAVVQLPDWFEALNQDFRYQLTPIGQFAQAIVFKEIAGNRFTIKTDKPRVKVSWQVTGVRHDPYANAYRIPVEENKPAAERGKYLHPELYGQPETQGVTYDPRRPEPQP